MGAAGATFIITGGNVFVTALVYAGCGATTGAAVIYEEESHAPPYINAVIHSANFTGVVLNDIRASSFKFVNCIGLDHLHEALGCIFINAFSSNPNDLERLKTVGACVNRGVNGKSGYAENHAAFWEKHDESYLADLVTNLGETVVSAFGGEVGKGLAQGALRIFGLAENQQVKKDQSAEIVL